MAYFSDRRIDPKRNRASRCRKLGFEGLEDRRLLATYIVEEFSVDLSSPQPNGDLSLRAAVNAANNNDGLDIVRIPQSSAGQTITLTQSQPILITEPVIIVSETFQTAIVRSSQFLAPFAFEINVNQPSTAFFTQIEGFDISGFTSGIVVTNLNRSDAQLLVTRNRLQNNSANGIEIKENIFDAIEISNNEISGNTRGVYVHSQSGSPSFNGDLFIVPDVNDGRNLIHSNSLAGIEISGFDSSASNSRRISIGGNYVYNNASGAGINIDSVDAPLTISGNFIGRNFFTNAFQANQTGIKINANNVTGTSFIDNNEIGGNTLDGIQISNSNMPNLTISNNLVGLDVNSFSRPNGSNGISVINGDFLSMTGNIVATNGADGVRIDSIQGAKIGTIASGDANQIILNGGDGIELLDGTSDISIEGNLIQQNSGIGVHLRLDAGTGNSVSENSFIDNGGLPIDLEQIFVGNVGPNENDIDDQDVGPNHLQNYGVLSNVMDLGGNNWQVRVDLDVKTPGDYYLEFYKVDEATMSYTPLKDGQGVLLWDIVSVSPSQIKQGVDVAVPIPIPSQYGLLENDRIAVLTTSITSQSAPSDLSTSEFSNILSITESPLPGDFNGDGTVNALDFTIWANNYGADNITPFSLADADGDGDVDGADFLAWQRNFGADTSGAVGTGLALVAGDYNFDGVVEDNDYDVWLSSFGSTSNLDADGNGNGIIDMADLAIFQENFMLTTLEVMPGDFDSSGVVDSADFFLWSEGDMLADADGDGDVDDDDFDVFEANFGLTHASQAPVITGNTSGMPLEIPMAVPRVLSLSLGDTISAFDFTSVVGSGEQLRSIPFNGVDTVNIRFSEEVFVTENTLQVTNLDGSSPATVSDFTYDLDTQTASWTFSADFADGRYLLSLADDIYDLDHKKLDGEFRNAWTLADASSAEFPTGDGIAGGDFHFHATILAADTNHDNIDGATDYTEWLSIEPGRIYVSTTVDELDGDLSMGDVSLREAVQYANAASEPITIVVPAGDYTLTRSGTEMNDSSQLDLDVTGNLSIVGAGPGLTYIDNSGLSTSAPRIFEVKSGGKLALSHVTLTSGSAVGYAVALAGVVEDGAIFELIDSAVVNHDAMGIGAISVGAANVTVRRSVFTNNSSNYTTPALHVNPGSGSATLTIGESIFALNQGGTYSSTSNVYTTGNVSKINEGFNLFDDASGGFFDTTSGTGDYQGTPDFVVTSVADTFDHADNEDALSLREAVDLANISAGHMEVWLPAWKFVLTRDRATYGTGSTDVDVSFGDLDITDSIVLRGVNGRTSVQWKSEIHDAVFDLIGDFDNDGQAGQSVSGSDFLVWQNQYGSGSVDPAFWEQFTADADDDGDVDSDDHALWSAYYGNTLEIFDILL